MRKATEKEKKLALEYAIQYSTVEAWMTARNRARNTEKYERKNETFRLVQARLNGMIDLLEVLDLHFFIENQDSDTMLLSAYKFDTDKKLFELTIVYDTEKSWHISD